MTKKKMMRIVVVMMMVMVVVVREGSGLEGRSKWGGSCLKGATTEGWERVGTTRLYVEVRSECRRKCVCSQVP